MGKAETAQGVAVQLATLELREQEFRQFWRELLDLAGVVRQLHSRGAKLAVSRIFPGSELLPGCGAEVGGFRRSSPPRRGVGRGLSTVLARRLGHIRHKGNHKLKDKKLLFTPRHEFFSLDAGALILSWNEVWERL